MPMFVLHCLDKPDSFALRAATREAHLTYVGAHPAMRIGGPYLDREGSPVGSMIVVETSDEAAARAFSKDDPYNRAGLFEAVEIRPWVHFAGHLP
ncbi:MAG: hypothetical protein JWO72_1065 [Caulobacteraceae bacterium]|nr:hypothetical protein [Caulobacteraceae bacterium]